jgi:cytochrome o ubiquinol oxidase operon protein cyoD
MKNFKALISYVVGFILSLLLTIAAYLFAVKHLLVGSGLIFTIVTMAIIQLYVQLIFFLHLGQGLGAKSKLWVFLFTVLAIAVVVGGSLWIMSNLNYNMTPQDVNNYLMEQNGGF